MHWILEIAVNVAKRGKPTGWAIQGSNIFKNRAKNHGLHPRALQNPVQFHLSSKDSRHRS